MRWRLRAVVGFLCVVALMGGGIAQAVNIDNFNCTTQHVDKVTPGPSTLAAACAIGGFRMMTLSNVVGPLGASGDVIGGVLSLSNDSLTTSTLTLTWNANGVGLGGVDLTAASATDISLAILSIDQGNVNLTVSVTETAGAGGATASKLISGVGIGTQQFAFNTFTNFVNTDFTQVDSISLVIEATGLASDATLDFFQTDEHFSDVPEPGTFLLLGTGLGGLSLVLLARRRQRL